MNYNQSGVGGRRGRPKRVVDPSTGIVQSPSSQIIPNPYELNQQQAPPSNGMGMDYGFNIPGQMPSTPPYGFNPAQKPYQPHEERMDNYASNQYATQLLAEPMVRNIASAYGSALVDSGRSHIEKYVPVTALRYYFAVDADYVISKLALLFFPFSQKDWSVKYEQDGGPLQPRYEKNAPDLYIPIMAFLTYVVVAGLALGTNDEFSPEKLGKLTSSALAWGVVELLVLSLTPYVINIETSLKLLDLLAYCGYKYVGINASILLSLLFGRVGYYVFLVYFSISLAFFFIRSLKLRVVPEGNASYTASGNKRRLYFILFVATIQPLFMWWLSYHLL